MTNETLLRYTKSYIKSSPTEQYMFYYCLFLKRQFFLWRSTICLPSVLQGFCIKL